MDNKKHNKKDKKDKKSRREKKSRKEQRKHSDIKRSPNPSRMVKGSEVGINMEIILQNKDQIENNGWQLEVFTPVKSTSKEGITRKLTKFWKNPSPRIES